MLLLGWLYLQEGGLRERFLEADSVLGMMTANNAIAILAQSSEAYALSLAPIALVYTVESSQPFFILAYGLILSVVAPKLFDEDTSRSAMIVKMVSTVVLFSGIYLIYR